MDREVRKKYRERANRARRGLLKEKEEHGDIRDGSGKRYRAGAFYVLSGDAGKAIEFYDWFQSEFPDDIGEPVFDLYWAIAAYRIGRTDEARARLRDAMLQNLYMLPSLFGECWSKMDIWHGSNHQDPEYLKEVEEFLNEPTPDEREWMRQEFYSEAFRELRDAYIDHFGRLLNERDIDERRKILDSWNRSATRIVNNG